MLGIASRMPQEVMDITTEEEVVLREDETYFWIGGAGLMGDDIEDLDDCKDGDEIGDGLADICDEAGDHVVLRGPLDVPDVEEQESETGH